MEVVQDREVIVIGGSLAGLFAAAASASAGAHTTIIERDVLPTEPSSRKGVPQDRQPTGNSQNPADKRQHNRKNIHCVEKSHQREWISHSAKQCAKHHRSGRFK